ncbi:MAG: murein L,D-transpeptidase [Dichotomicrobium sp.]
MLRVLISAAAIVLAVSANTPAPAVEPGAPKEPLGRMDAVAFALQHRLGETFRDVSEAERRERGALAAFYAENGYDFLWIDEDGLTDRARAAAKVFERADRFALRPGNYPFPDPDAVKSAERPDVQWLADAEYRISRSVLAYARHAQSGHVEPSSVSRILDIEPDAPDPLAVLRGLARDDVEVTSYLEAFNPSQPQFVGLLERLRELRRLSKTPTITIPDGDLVKPGESHPHVALVRQRLDVPDSDAAETYDDELLAAVEAFQRKNGLHVDGLIGPATRRALNRSPADKIDSLRVNLERWRWLPNDLGARYVRVNIPEFMVRLVDNGTTAFEERIVVGKPRHATPVLADQMELVVFNPYWNVPYSIMKNEIVPQVQRSPGYLSRNNLQVIWRGRRRVDPYRVDWQNVDLGKVRLRQSPGARNALGKIKFLFPNKHSVYLHDTPSKHLFNQSRRAYSHGCMRVRNPRAFAAAIMGPQGWSEAEIDSAIARGDNRAVRLEKPLPVYITYFTAAVLDSGGIGYFGDLYGHDGKTLKALDRAQKNVQG